MTTPPGGSRAQLEPATWVNLRAEPADAASTDAPLTILAGWGGGGKYDHTEVVETEHAVFILVFIEHWVPTVPEPGVTHVRTMELRREYIKVHLAAPLGARTLIGSVGPTSTWGGMLLADRPPLDTVMSCRRATASSLAQDLIARFEEVLLIQATHETLVAHTQAKSGAKVPPQVNLPEERPTDSTTLTTT